MPGLLMLYFSLFASFWFNPFGMPIPKQPTAVKKPDEVQE